MKVWKYNGPINIVINELTNDIYLKLELNKNIVINKEDINNIIKKVVDNEYEMCPGNFLYYKGYYKVIQKQLINKVYNEYLILYMVKKISIRKIKPKLLNWINWVLYRPDSGLRYNSIKNNFKKTVDINDKNKEVIELDIDIDLSDTVNFEKNINELRKLLGGILKKN